VRSSAPTGDLPRFGIERIAAVDRVEVASTSWLRTKTPVTPSSIVSEHVRVDVCSVTCATRIAVAVEVKSKTNGYANISGPSTTSASTMMIARATVASRSADAGDTCLKTFGEGKREGTADQ
jgi:hypothetical protein